MADNQVDDLLQFIGFALSREQAEALLRQEGGNLERAADKYWDNPTGCISKPDDGGYDVAAFGADRYGQHDGNNIPTFNIDYAPGVDHYPHSGTHSVAPSRPPSRTSQRSGASPTNGHVIQSIEHGQESGVTGQSSTVFGPANKDQNYDPQQWSMVPISSSAEFVPDALSSRRKREESGPAILKPLANDDYLPALIAILHTIPQFRNAFLVPHLSLPDYQAGTEWWKGDPWAPLSTTDLETQQANDTQDLSLIHETQRLMAFLDNTDRAYGSVGGLQKTETWCMPQSDLDGSDDDLLKFLLKWGNAYSATTAEPIDGVFRSVFSADGQRRESFVLDASVIHRDHDENLTLYDVLDEQLFDSASGSGTAFILDASNVLILRLENSNLNATSLDCKIPATFHVNRYLEENKEQVASMIQEKKQYEAQIKEIQARADKLKYHTTQKIRPGEKMETLKLLKTSMVAFEPRPGDLIHDPKSATILSQLQEVYESIERKLATFEEQKKQVRQTLDSISNRFKVQMDNDAGQPGEDMVEDDTPSQTDPHTYKLCGVATQSSVVYLKHPTANAVDYWWRMEYSTATSDAVILRERLTLPVVLSRASSEHRSALLIYANSAALSPEPAPLSRALTQFVQADNAAFLEELQQDLPYNHRNSPPIEPIGGWQTEPPAYQYSQPLQPFGSHGYDTGDSAWEDISAKEFYSQNGGTESVGRSGVQEAGEYNGGIDAWASGSVASSDTVAGDPMDAETDTEAQDSDMRPKVEGQETISMRDIEMVDVEVNGETGPARRRNREEREPSVRHIEMLERDGR